MKFETLQIKKIVYWLLVAKKEKLKKNFQTLSASPWRFIPRKLKSDNLNTNSPAFESQDLYRGYCC